jgi:hypothetical protein
MTRRGDGSKPWRPSAEHTLALDMTTHRIYVFLPASHRGRCSTNAEGDAHQLGWRRHNSPSAVSAFFGLRST